MTFTVMGLSQTGLVSLGLDMVDAGVIRWYLDFRGSGAMKTTEIDGEIYCWIDQGYLASEMPILGLSTRDAIGRRLTKLVKAQVLKKILRKHAGGTWAYYAPGECLSGLLTSTHRDEKPCATGIESRVTHRDGKSDYSSIIRDSCIKDNTKSGTPSAQHVAFASLLFERHRKIDPGYLGGKKETDLSSTFERWARDIEKIETIDKRPSEMIESVIRWCQTDGNFWAPNILSGKKLREKFSVMVAQMKRDGKGQFDTIRTGASFEPSQSPYDRLARKEITYEEFVRLVDGETNG